MLSLGFKTAREGTQTTVRAPLKIFVGDTQALLSTSLMLSMAEYMISLVVQEYLMGSEPHSRLNFSWKKIPNPFKNISAVSSY
jgi:hypothetical protein